MLKYEEAATEGRKAHQSNAVLKQQIEAQQQHILRLDEQIEGHRRSDDDSRERSIQLEHELKDLKDVTPDHNSEPLELEREMLDLRQQLQISEQGRQETRARLDELEQLRQQHERKIRDCEVGNTFSQARTPLIKHRILIL